MKRSVTVLLLILMLLLGVQRTPEAQVGDAIILTTKVVAMGGCAHIQQRPGDTVTMYPQEAP